MIARSEMVFLSIQSFDRTFNSFKLSQKSPNVICRSSGKIANADGPEWIANSMSSLLQTESATQILAQGEEIPLMFQSRPQLSWVGGCHRIDFPNDIFENTLYLLICITYEVGNHR